jgi:hypothetical protein
VLKTTRIPDLLGSSGLSLVENTALIKPVMRYPQ